MKIVAGMIVEGAKDADEEQDHGVYPYYGAKSDYTALGLLDHIPF